MKQINTGIITEAELSAARKQARAKLARQMVEQEMGLANSDLPVVKGPMPIENEPQFTITLDLAPHSDRIIIDGVVYMQGRTYTVGKRLYDNMREIQARGWGHQEEIDGKDRNFYRKQKIVNITPNGVMTEMVARKA